MTTKEEDFVEHLFSATTHDYLLCFTEAGRMYWLKAYRVPEGSRTSRGRSLANVLEMGEDEKLAAILCVRELNDTSHNIFMATKNGTVKKTVLAAYKNVRTAGINAINIDEDDRLIGVRLTSGTDEIVISTHNGKAIRFNEEDVRQMGRIAHGVRGVRLLDDDEVVSVDVIEPDSTLLVVTENGYGKRTEFDEYRRTKRGGQGVKSIQTSERNGKVVCAHTVMEDNRLMLISEGGQTICIGLSDVRVIGRSTQGVRLVRLKPGDRLVSAAVLAPEEDAPEGAEKPAGEDGVPVEAQPPADSAAVSEPQSTPEEGEAPAESQIADGTETGEGEDSVELPE